VPVGDAVVDPPGVRRPLVGVGPGDAADHERLVLAVRAGAKLPLVEVERAADQVAGQAVVAERGQLRFQLLPLEVGLEDEGVGGAWAAKAFFSWSNRKVMQLAQTSGQPSARKRWACVRNSPLQKATTGEPARPGTR
jgi:hypothetical protein